MQITVDLNAINTLGRSGQRVDEAIEKALDRCAQIALQAKAREIDNTYKRPIPRGKGGKPKWQRSGAWQGGQRIERKRGERSIVTQGPAERYEGRLSALPRSRDGVNRRNAAAQNATAKIEPQLQAVFESELNNALR
jgi:hypothetical protein